MMSIANAAFLAALPKAELHLHIEGTLTPARKIMFAGRNKVAVPKLYTTPAKSAGARVDGSGDAYSTAETDARLWALLDLYYDGLKVLHTAQDFYDVTFDHFAECARTNILYSEISFDLQAHTARGVSVDTVIQGMAEAQAEAKIKFGVESGLIMCIDRERSLDSALEMLESARPYRHLIVGIGLDGAEDGHPPVKFKVAYEKARSEGYNLTAHCGPDVRDVLEHYRQCITELGVSRIDHGVNVVEDPGLVDMALERNIFMTACPIWIEGDAEPRWSQNIKEMLGLGLSVTVNTDDPAYVESGHFDMMLPRFVQAAEVSEADVIRLTRNAFLGAWTSEESRKGFLRKLDDFEKAHCSVASAGADATL